MEKETLERTRARLEDALTLVSPDREALGRVLGELGHVNLKLGREVEALVHLLASQILLTSLNIPEARVVERWVGRLREEMGEERFMEAFHKALPHAGFLLVQHLGKDEAEGAMDRFIRIKAEGIDFHGEKG